MTDSAVTDSAAGKATGATPSPAVSVAHSARRIDWVDTARGIGIIFVVLGHHHDHPLYSYIYSFHMPLFFFLSGMMFKNTSGQDFSTFALRRARTLLIPYFIFAPLLFAVWWALGTFVDPRVLEGYSLTKNIIGIFYAQGQLDYMRWGVELWFLPCLFLTSLAYFFIARLPLLYQFVSVVVCALAGLALLHLLPFRLPWSVDIGLVALGFVWVGQQVSGWLQARQMSWKAVVILAILLAINIIGFELNPVRVDLFLGNYGNYVWFYLSAVSGCLFYTLLARLLPPVTVLVFIGVNSLVFYMLHMRALTALNLIFSKVPALAVSDHTVAGALLVSLLQLLVLVPAVLIINRWFPWTLGRRR